MVAAADTTSFVLLAGTENRSPLRLSSTRPRSSWAKMFQVARSNGGWSSRRETRFSTEPRLWACRETAALIVSDARISFRIEHVGDKVDQHKDHGQEQNAALDGRQVALLNREQHVPAHARPGEYRLGQDAAGQIVAYIESEYRDDRQQRIAQRVPANDAPLAESLGARRPDEIRGQDVEHRSARHARQKRDRAGAQRQRGQDEKLGSPIPGRRQPAQRHREQQNQQQANPVDRERDP